MWDKLSQKKLQYIVEANPDEDTIRERLGNLKRLVRDFDLCDCCEGMPRRFPVKGVLQNGNFKTCYAARRNFRYCKQYGYENPKKLCYPLIDHAWYFRAKDRTAFLVSSSYLSESEIHNLMDDCRWWNDIANGDYSGLKYKVLGKEYKFYTADTNVIIFWWEDK